MRKHDGRAFLWVGSVLYYPSSAPVSVVAHTARALYNALLHEQIIPSRVVDREWWVRVILGSRTSCGCTTLDKAPVRTSVNRSRLLSGLDITGPSANQYSSLPKGRESIMTAFEQPCDAEPHWSLEHLNIAPAPRAKADSTALQWTRSTSTRFLRLGISPNQKPPQQHPRRPFRPQGVAPNKA